MIRYCRHRDIDKQRWDTAVNSSLTPLLYAQSWFLDRVCNSWDALILDDYAAVFPLPVQNKFGLRYSFQPFFCQQLGIFSATAVTPGVFTAFVTAIPRKFLWVRLNLNANLSEESIRDYSLASLVNQELPLQEEYALVAARYAQNTRKNLKRAQQHFAAIDENTSLEALLQLYAAHYPGLEKHNYARFSSLLEACASHARLEVTGKRNEKGELVSAVLFITFGNRVYTLINASSEEGKKEYSTFLLFDHFIRKNAGQPLVLDFEGSRIPGIARFNEGLGAVAKPYYHLEINRLSWLGWK